MFGSVRTVFTSRWKALWWACGVLLTAYCSVPSPDVQSHKLAKHEEHLNPWAKDYHPSDQPIAPTDPVDNLRDIVKKAKEAERHHGEQKAVNPWAKKHA